MLIHSARVSEINQDLGGLQGFLQIGGDLHAQGILTNQGTDIRSQNVRPLTLQGTDDLKFRIVLRE